MRGLTQHHTPGYLFAARAANSQLRALGPLMEAWIKMAGQLALADRGAAFTHRRTAADTFNIGDMDAV